MMVNLFASGADYAVGGGWVDTEVLWLFSLVDPQE